MVTGRASARARPPALPGRRWRRGWRARRGSRAASRLLPRLDFVAARVAPLDLLPERLTFLVGWFGSAEGCMSLSISAYVGAGSRVVRDARFPRRRGRLSASVALSAVRVLSDRPSVSRSSGRPVDRRSSRPRPCVETGTSASAPGHHARREVIEEDVELRQRPRCIRRLHPLAQLVEVKSSGQEMLL